MTTYQVEVTETGFVAGELHQKGEKLTLTERQKDCGLRRGRIKVLGEKEAPKEPEAGEPSEEDTIRARLTELGVKVHPKAKLETLKKKLAEVEDSGLE